MDALTYNLRKIHDISGHGSYSTRANRWAMLQKIAEDLKQGGYRLESASSLKPKHIEYLLGLWRSGELSEGTILNRLATLRWWADAVNKRSMMFKDNEAYGVSKVRATGKPRAKELPTAALEQISCPRAKLSLKLQQAFGLRAEEAIKFTAGEAIRADEPDRIYLKPSWTKGGRARFVPLTNHEQRDLLAEVVKVAGVESLIPKDKSYIQQLRTYKYQALRAGIRNPHGLRHAYAQRRYVELTGWQPPAKGGVLSTDQAALRKDATARLQISQELGHNRISITDIYLGKRVIA